SPSVAAIPDSVSPGLTTWGTADHAGAANVANASAALRRAPTVAFSNVRTVLLSRMSSTASRPGRCALASRRSYVSWAGSFRPGLRLRQELVGLAPALALDPQGDVAAAELVEGPVGGQHRFDPAIGEV